MEIPRRIRPYTESEMRSKKSGAVNEKACFVRPLNVTLLTAAVKDNLARWCMPSVSRAEIEPLLGGHSSTGKQNDVILAE